MTTRHSQSELRELEPTVQQLREQLDQAQRVIENLSHEVRTPLGVIREYASLLADEIVGEVNAEQRRYLQIVEARADDLHRMVNNMLDLSRLNSGGIGLHRQAVQPHEIIDRVGELFLPSASCRDISFKFTPAAGLPAVYGDRDKLLQALTNLVTNAVKYSRRPGLVCIESNYDALRELVVFSVTDNGRGLTKDQLQRIFRRFHRLQRDSQQTEGFGLGLDIVQEWTDLHYGQLEVESELGVGTTFHLAIPVNDPLVIVPRYLRYLHGQTSLSELTLYFVTTNEDACELTADQILQESLGRSEIAFRRPQGSWLVLSSPNEDDLASRLPKDSIDSTGTHIDLTVNGRASCPTDESQVLSRMRELLIVPEPKSRPILRKTANRRHVRQAKPFDG